MEFNLPARLDMSLEDLTECQGSHPRPDDLDLFWDAQISEGC